MKVCYFIILMCSSIIVQAQADQPPIDERLYPVYEKAYLERLQEYSPFMIQRWNYYLDHAYYITDYVAEKEVTPYPTVIIEDLENINILLLEKNQKIFRSHSKRMVYKIVGQDKVLVYYSGKHFNKKLNATLGRTYPRN